jgi:hypothetical protein
MDIFFFLRMNGGLKVTIKVKVKDNLLLQSLQTLTKVNLVDNKNIFNRGLSLEFNSFHVRKLFTNTHQNG